MMAAAKSSDAQIRTTTHNGIPLDLPIGIRLVGTLLSVPAGYLAPWPPLSKRYSVTDTGRIAFNFWMPSRRYVEIDSLSIAGSRPQEKGRPPPPSDAYVVNVRDFSLRAKDELAHRAPEKQMENLIKLNGQEAYSFQQEDFGLVRFWRNDWPYPNPEPFLRFKHMEGSDLQVLLRCIPPHRSAPNPLCDGDIYFPGEQLSFYVVFPRDQLPNWRNSLFAARDLFNSWKVTP
jgi:hypothetical protein